MYKKYNLKCFEKRMQKFFGVSVVCFPKAKIPRESEQDGKSDEGVRGKIFTFQSIDRTDCDSEYKMNDSRH